MVFLKIYNGTKVEEGRSEHNDFDMLLISNNCNELSELLNQYKY